jgi:hypothetical protein
VAGNGNGGVYGSTLYNCTVTSNLGGWAAVWGSTLYNSTVTDNSSRGLVGSTLYNCMVTGNLREAVTGSRLYNCTVAGNSYGGVYGGSTLYNSIIYYNSGGNYDESTTLNFCCTTPLPTNGVGNITGPPLFMDMAAGDFRLREESPCIDAGTNLLGLTWTYGTGTYDPDTGEEIMAVAFYAHDPTDMLGNTRFIDGNFDGRVAWDNGAYEFNSFRPPRFTCPPQLMPDCWKLSITGPPNKWVRLQRSSDLKNWEDWWERSDGNRGSPSPVFMGEAGIGQFNDEDISQKAMFYRVVVE